MSASVQVVLAELAGQGLFPCKFVKVDTLTLQNYAPDILKLNPFGELPILVYKGKSIYGPHLIVELICEVLERAGSADGRSAADALMPSDPMVRVKVRRWFGWVRTAYYYQLAHVWEALWWGPMLRICYKDEASLANDLPSGRPEDTVSALESFKHVAVSWHGVGWP